MHFLPDYVNLIPILCQERGKKNMNKTELIAVAAENAGMTKKDTERILNAAIDAITAALVRGEKVQLSGFGTFETKDRGQVRQ